MKKNLLGVLVGMLIMSTFTSCTEPNKEKKTTSIDETTVTSTSVSEGADESIGAGAVTGMLTGVSAITGEKEIMGISVSTLPPGTAAVIAVKKGASAIVKSPVAEDIEP